MSLANQGRIDAVAAILAAGGYLALHTASPGVAGAQDTSETAYGGYVRIPFTSADFSQDGTTGIATSINDLAFNACSGSPGADLTDVSLGLSATGAGTLIVYGSLTVQKTLSVGDQPYFPAGTLTIG